MGRSRQGCEDVHQDGRGRVMRRFHGLPGAFPMFGLLAATVLCGASSADASAARPSALWIQPDDAQRQADPSSLRIDLPRTHLSGYSQDVRGEVLNYHSPIPTINSSLLVRSEDRVRSIAWESQPVPPDLGEEVVTFALMLGIDVNVDPRTFDFRVNGQDVFQIQNPTEASLGQTMVWEGQGIRGEFRVTFMDRYGDAMGFFFLTIPRHFWEPGEAVQFEVLGESAGARTWLLVFRDPLEPYVRLNNAPAVVRTDEGEAQIIRLDLLTLGERDRFRMESAIGSVDSVVTMGHSRFTLPVPAVEVPRDVDLELLLGSHRTEVSYQVTPPRRMEIHLHHHTHLDIGYTHHQDEVERLQWAHLEEALRLGEESEGYPEGARFVWQPEGIWPVDTYVRAHPGEKTDLLLEGIRRGWIELDGMYAGLLTGLANEEALLRAFEAARRLGELSGVPIESEMVSDIPGFSWGLVEAMSRHGLKYLSIGPNFGHRIGRLTEELGDQPFYWEGPSGESRVLTWVSGGGYAWFHTGLGYDSITARLDEEKVFRYLDQLVSTDYPYDLSYLRYNIGSDNGPPDPELARSVQDWNQRYASPVLRIAGMTETFREFERRYGSTLPTYRGDMTGHWEDGAASSARETAMVRRAAENLVQTEKLAGLRGAELDSDALREAWRNVLLFYEHTWGSWNSISEPYSDLTVTSWERKKAFAEKAAELADHLRSTALSDTGEDTERKIAVHNTLPWHRSGLVVLPAEASREGDRVTELGRGPVPSQRLASGDLAFLARDVPVEGIREFKVEPGAAYPAPESGEPVGGTVATSTYELTVDDSGQVTSLVHRPSGRELIDSSQGGFNQYVYVPGRDPSTAVSARPETIRWIDEGPLVWTLEITTPGKGLREPVVTLVRLVEGLDRVEISNRIAKEWVLDPEAVLFRFPLAIEEPEVRFDVPFGVVRTEEDQVPGSSKNYFSIQRWVDVSDEQGGVTLTSVDAPLIQLGEIRTDPIVAGWLGRAEPSATIYSYVMNNYWETNYRAAQDDDVEFRYSLRAHGPFQAEEAERFGLDEARPLVVREVGPRPTEADLLGTPPEVPREFRAAWVATVANINWPSRPGLPVSQQKDEALALLDLLDSLNFNAVIFQVRPQADALYESEIEPWSYYLTGTQGQGPDPFYDPLTFWVEEAHNRGLELHVWLNPYRAHHTSGGEVTEASIVRRKPELVVSLQQGFWWMDPALEGTQAHSLEVVKDIVRRYDIDGVHFDDYFYPYPEYNGGEDFPDHKSWEEYLRNGGQLPRGDWRREAVNTFIRRCYDAIKAEKPHVKFGLSPFGIWRPGNPGSIQGFDQYSQLYADARRWLNEGWIDYWTPQLYWPVNQIPQSYPVLLGWWTQENPLNRHIWPGINIGNVSGNEGVDEAVNQIMITRGMIPSGPGNVHWSIGPLVSRDTLAQGIRSGPYSEDALVPTSPWLDDQAPAVPIVEVAVDGLEARVSWGHPDPDDVFKWVLYHRTGDRWSYGILNRGETEAFIPLELTPSGQSTRTGRAPASEQGSSEASTLTAVAVAAVDRTGNQSQAVVIPVPSG